jgi:hypothetical protein
MHIYIAAVESRFICGRYMVREFRTLLLIRSQYNACLSFDSQKKNRKVCNRSNDIEKKCQIFSNSATLLIKKA